MTEEAIKAEVELEFTKNIKELAKDAVREANENHQNPAGEKGNLDIIKHLVKRLLVHQLILEDRVNRTNYWLIVLSIIMAAGALLSIVSFFKGVKF